MAEYAKVGPGKKFSITIHVPDDVAAQWPDRSTAERLIEEVYRAMNGVPVAQQPARLRARPAFLVLVFVVLLAIGAGAGYLGARIYMGSSSPVDRPVVTAAPRAAPAAAPEVTPAEPSPAPQPTADLSRPPGAAVGPQAAPATGSPQASPQSAQAPAPAYHVQVGAFRLRENAESLVQLLDSDGFPAKVLNLGSLYIVYVGTFTDPKAADRLADELRAHRYDVVVIQAQAD